MPDPFRQQLMNKQRQETVDEDIVKKQGTILDPKRFPPIFVAKISSFDGLFGGTQRYTIIPLLGQHKAASAETISYAGVCDESLSQIADNTFVVVQRDPLRILGTTSGMTGGASSGCGCCESRYGVLASAT